MLNLDTHMVVALLQGDLRPPEELLVLKEEWAISDIVLWELAKLIQLGRLEMEQIPPLTRDGRMLESRMIPLARMSP